jgi:hypothetical protein
MNILIHFKIKRYARMSQSGGKISFLFVVNSCIKVRLKSLNGEFMLLFSNFVKIVLYLYIAINIVLPRITSFSIRKGSNPSITHMHRLKKTIEKKSALEAWQVCDCLFIEHFSFNENILHPSP